MTVAAPRRAPWITVHEPMADGAHWIVERPDASPLRVSADIGALLSTLDGRDAAAVARRLGVPWTAELVTHAVERLDGLGLIDGPNAAAPKPERRFVVVSPTTWQLRVVKADRLLAPIRPLLVRLSGNAVLFTALALLAGGLIALACQGSALGQALGSPLPLSTFALIWAGLAATTVIHEFGHGATLTHFHGRPGWFGVMLFYLTPACFCEVTDGWRLAKPSQRVSVAMAGVVTQAAVAGCAAMVALAVPGGDGKSTLLGFSVVCYLSASVNLIPFVKLDGYLALMAYVDIPHLRDRSTAEARAWLLWRLFGVQHVRSLPAWTVPFGLACIGFPVLVLGIAAGRWSHVLLGMGLIGGVLVLVLFGYLGYLLVHGAWSLLRNAHRAGVGTARLVLTAFVALSACGALLTFLKVDNDIRAGYTHDSSGVHLVVPPGTEVTAGSHVELERGGLMFSTSLGSARIGTGRAERTTVPFSALTPFRTGVTTEGSTLPLIDVTGRLDPTGAARVQGAPMPAGTWLAHNYLLPVWHQIFGQED
ncbi:daptide biosynthesis intramembrane metalloprotease [Lentzea sp. BCCO 10_0061]|uniref:Daptide biosynthesis intramembrane metalloprotease n=1 Tax=Lentzea sokolovensis TaxID=3095429 RepID=A0ABU4V6W7_9PSEU|nr:daptide biosynthesis intramembrane metalloprotease [Lentzea sp. BCCO 10_0061]MDX8146959.1 daptide biosynthesis intramembrane metalloprotease [Lentzea sp. BCCO 10_0061]